MSEMTAERASGGGGGEGADGVGDLGGAVPSAEGGGGGGAAPAGGEPAGTAAAGAADGVRAPSARGARHEPWVETREGGWFFVNALLVSPALVVLFPLAAGLLVDALAPGREPSPFLDTIPFVASKAVPILGWLLVIPIWATVKALGMKQPSMARVALGFFLLVHLSFLGYAVRAWTGW
jgi:hypothetical protein